MITSGSDGPVSHSSRLLHAADAKGFRGKQAPRVAQPCLAHTLGQLGWAAVGRTDGPGHSLVSPRLRPSFPRPVIHGQRAGWRRHLQPHWPWHPLLRLQDRHVDACVLWQRQAVHRVESLRERIQADHSPKPEERSRLRADSSLLRRLPRLGHVLQDLRRRHADCPVYCHDCREAWWQGLPGEGQVEEKPSLHGQGLRGRLRWRIRRMVRLLADLRSWRAKRHIQGHPGSGKWRQGLRRQDWRHQAPSLHRQGLRGELRRRIWRLERLLQELRCWNADDCLQGYNGCC